MIRSFADKQTAEFWATGKSRRLPPDLRDSIQRKLAMLHAATDLKDLLVPPGNRLEALQGDRAGQHSIRINDRYRICFRWQDNVADDVEITDHYD
jgi:proteic killer suppression protein